MVMKLIKFTFFSLLLSTGFMVDANAQGLGNRGDGQRGGNGRPNIEHNQNAQRPAPASNDRGGVRQSNNRFETSTRPSVVRNNEPSRIDRGGMPNQNNHSIIKNDGRNDRRDPIRINNGSHANYSYAKPVHNFDHRKYNSYHYNNMSFYGNNGMYYRNYNNSFVRFMPPVGFQINILPAGYVNINLGSNAYYFYEGVYYQRYRQAYRVVEPPMGAIVYALPYGYERVDYRGELLYEYAGVLYDKVYHRGERVYQVVGYLS